MTWVGGRYMRNRGHLGKCESGAIPTRPELAHQKEDLIQVPLHTISHRILVPQTAARPKPGPAAAVSFG